MPESVDQSEQTPIAMRAAPAAIRRRPSRRRSLRRGVLLDPGWLFLVAGLVLIAAVVLIPARRETQYAQHLLARAQAVQNHRAERIQRYEEYLHNIDKGDEATLRALAAVQLNKAPDGTQVLIPGEPISERSASVFPALEPPPMQLPDDPRPAPNDRSTLERWATQDPTRLWLGALGILLVLIGLIPMSVRESADLAAA